MGENGFSMAVPCHNEEDVLQNNVDRIMVEAEDLENKWELLIVEDGCTDRTPDIAGEISSQHERVKHLHFEEKLGKGRAITEAFDNSNYEKLLFMDADLATNLKHIEGLLEELETHDMVIGSRYKEGASSDREIKRKVLSKTYNTAARILFRTDVKDHQCGFKGFRREAFKEIQDDIDSEHWFWDTEIIINAQRKNLDIREMPVDWKEKRDSGVDISQTVIHFSKKLFEQKMK